jgi:hypothetical protein
MIIANNVDWPREIMRERYPMQQYSVGISGV